MDAARTVPGQKARATRTEPLRDQLALLILGKRRLRRQDELVASLNEVADAVSSALSLEQVLECIVDRVKRISDADKAVLVLTNEHDDTLDMETIVVRGNQQQHPQEWWEELLEPLSQRAMPGHEVLIERFPEHHAWILTAPIRVKDHPIGLICAINGDDRPVSETHIDFISILSAFAATAIENARLAEEGRYVLLASERDRIAHEMHDGVIQSLFSISLGLEVCKSQVLHDPQLAASRLDELQKHLNVAMTELRRFVYDLRPMKLTELGLTGAIEYWIREVTLGTGVKGTLIADWEHPLLQPATEACLYRIAKESVSNVMRHSQATRFEVQLSGEDGLVRLTVADNGCGFDPVVAETNGRPGIGLRSMRDRMEREGGVLLVESAPECGTKIVAELRPEVL